MAGRLMGSLRSRNISQIITERITHSILSGELKPGERLPTEEEFAARIGAGKSSVREAIKILEALGVLEIRRGEGTYVVDEFKGAMLDPLVYGILLAEKSADDVIAFKIGVQRMAAEDLAEHAAGKRCANVLDLEPGADETLLTMELKLADEVTNPLVGELYREAVRIAAYVQESHEEELSPWMRKYVQAIVDGDKALLEALFDEERSILKATDGNQ